MRNITRSSRCIELSARTARRRRGVLLLALLSLALPLQAARADGGLIGARFPALSPDARTIVFSYWGDLWSADVSTDPALPATAHRLTDHLGFEQQPQFSPDGAWLAFVSDRSGNDDIWIMPAQGGAAAQVTTYSGPDALCGWTREGQLIYSSNRGLWSDDLYLIDPRRGEHPGAPAPRQLTRLDHLGSTQGRELSGGGFVYTRGNARWWRKNYRGTAQFDLWRIAPDGAQSAVTDYSGNDHWPLPAPDGQSCYFVSDRDGIDNIYRLALDGSATADRITLHDSDGVQWPALSADGSALAYEWSGGLWIAATAGGRSLPLSLSVAGELKDNWVGKQEFKDSAAEYAVSASGDYTVFCNNGDLWGVKDPKLWDKPRDKPDQDITLAWRLSATDGARERQAAFAPDNRRIAYSSDADGDYEIYLLDLQTSETRKLTDNAVDDCNPQFDPCGANALFYYSGNRRLLRQDLDSGAVNVVASGRFRGSFNYQGFSVSPDGKWVAYNDELDDWSSEVFIVDSAGLQPPVNICKNPADDRFAGWSADGRRIALRSTRAGGLYRGSGDSAAFVLDLDPEPDKFDLSFISATDAEDKADDEDEDGEDDERGGDEDSAADAAADADGRKDGKSGKKSAPPVVVTIDFDDIDLRWRQVGSGGPVSDALLSADGEWLVYKRRTDGGRGRSRAGAKYELAAVEIETGEDKKLGDGDWQQLQFAADGKRICYLDGGVLKYAKFKDGDLSGTETLSARGDLWLDRRARWRQMYREGWRTLGEQFYDPQMHGCDWPGLYEKYRPQVEAAGTPEEFGLTFRELLGELNASHLEISAPKSYSGASHESGSLGLEFDGSFAGPGLKVAHITYQGPADRPGVDIVTGDVILQIAGRNVSAGECWQGALEDMSGRPVRLLRAARAGEAADAETVIKAVGYAQYKDLLYREWELANERSVEELSGGRIGYIHIRGMSGSELEKFAREFYSVTFDKDALIVDVRFNPGGFIHEQLFELLDRKPFGYASHRDSERVRQPAGLYDKPKALLINSRSGSDAEIFPTGWRNLGLGPIIGVDTYGAVIGTTSFDLVDGTSVRLPLEGWWDLDGRNLELAGTPPDIYQEVDPNELAAGRDAQLELAVKTLLEELK